MSVVSRILNPYEKPSGKLDVYAIINDAAVKGQELSAEDWRQIAVATWVRIDRHERICMMRGVVLMLGICYLILDRHGLSVAAVANVLRVLF